jgi:hypothetical protein
MSAAGDCCQQGLVNIRGTSALAFANHGIMFKQFVTDDGGLEWDRLSGSPPMKLKDCSLFAP